MSIKLGYVVSSLAEHTKLGHYKRGSVNSWVLAMVENILRKSNTQPGFYRWKGVGPDPGDFCHVLALNATVVYRVMAIHNGWGKQLDELAAIHHRS